MRATRGSAACGSAPLRRHDDRGANLVEFAIAVTLLLLVMFGVIEFTKAWYDKQSLAQGVRETARQGIVANYDGGFASCALGDPASSLECQARERIDLDDVDVSVTMGAALGDPLTVSAELTLDSITGLLSPFISGRTIESTVTMRTERLP